MTVKDWGGDEVGWDGMGWVVETAVKRDRCWK